MTRQNKKRSNKKSLSRRIALAVIPHGANDYQPHLIRRYGLLAVLFFIVCTQVIYNVNHTGSVLGDSANVSLEALVDETNKVRKEYGLESVALNKRLNQAAYLKASNMLEDQYWGHTSPSGVEPWKWLADVEYGYTKAGENLAKNFYTAEAVNTAWMNSTEHRKNILDPVYTEVGFAVASGSLEGKATTIVVAFYGRPTGTGVVAVGAAVESAQNSSLNLVARLGVGVQSATPAALGSIILLTFLMMVAFAAHLYRDHIPESVNQPRHRHNHGAIKMSLMFMLILAMIVLYGGGQI